MGEAQNTLVLSNLNMGYYPSSYLFSDFRQGDALKTLAEERPDLEMRLWPSAIDVKKTKANKVNVQVEYLDGTIAVVQEEDIGDVTDNRFRQMATFYEKDEGRIVARLLLDHETWNEESLQVRIPSTEIRKEKYKFEYVGDIESVINYLSTLEFFLVMDFFANLRKVDGYKELIDSARIANFLKRAFLRDEALAISDDQYTENDQIPILRRVRKSSAKQLRIEYPHELV